MIAVYIIAPIIALSILYYLFPLLEVAGNSMYPTLKDGDKLISCRIFSRKNALVGDIYVIKSPEIEKRNLIKRLHEVTYAVDSEDMSFYFVGDNLGESYDSRHFGYLTSKSIVAKVIYPKKLLHKKERNYES